GRDDNDPAGLAMCLLDAVRTAIDWAGRPDGGPAPRSGAGAPAAMLRRERDTEIRLPPDAGVTSQVASEVVTFGADLWLLLDDVHLLRDHRTLEILETLLHRAPPNLHVVLGARADPAVHLSKLRLQQRLREVRDHDLRLSRDETAAVVALNGISLDEGQVTRLHRLTEGWAAGVGLAALSLASGRDPEPFLASFAQNDGAVAAYLVDEVLDSIDDDRREFMLDTCVPDVLPEALAVRLSGCDDAGQVLAELTAANSLLAITPDAHPVTYRYHALLRSYLRARLRAESVERFALRQAQTAVWFAEQGRATEAVDHAVYSGDAALVRATLHRYAVVLLLDGDPSRIEHAVAAVPAVLHSDPALLAVVAIANLQSVDLASARLHLAAAAVMGEPRVEQGQDDVDRGLTSSEDAGSPVLTFVPLPPDRVLTIASWTARQFVNTGDDPPLLTVSPRPRPDAATPNLRDLDVLEDLQQAFALVSSGRAAESLPMFERSLRGARQADRAFTVVSCLTGLTAASGVVGDVVETRRWAHEAIAHATPRGLGRSPNLLLPYVCAAEEAHEHCDLDLAEQLIGSAFAILGTTQGGSPDATSGGIDEQDAVQAVVRSLASVATCIDFARSDTDPARQREIVSRRLEKVRRLPPAPYAASLVGYEMVTLHRMALLTAQLTVAEAVEEISAAVPALAADVLAMRGLRALRLGHDREARAHVASVVSGEAEVSFAASAVAAALVEVTTARRNQQAAVAHEALLVALELTHSQDGLRMMLDVSAEVMGSLRSGRGRFGRHEPLVDRLLETAEGQAADSGPRRWRQNAGLGPAPLLSPREISLLRDLPSLLTVSEIARARSVSPNTIKTQLRSLFDKLEVSTRRDAVATGRHEGLI
ncbi:MAG: LuxR C-terminal-related transcriptional regulator, partial [Humibacillus sp.]|nr:LuxR C-terminal-related transcriptional regulator [Humibacillus sp.]